MRALSAATEPHGAACARRRAPAGCRAAARALPRQQSCAALSCAAQRAEALRARRAASARLCLRAEQRCCAASRAASARGVCCSATRGDAESGEGAAAPRLRFASALSRRRTLASALEEAVGACLASLGRDAPPPDVAFLFLSSHHAPSYTTAVPSLRAALPSLAAVLGCSAHSCAGDVLPEQDDTDELVRRRVPHEAEDGPALSLALACLPGVAVSTFHVEADDLPSADAPPSAWADALHAPQPGTAGSPPPQFILIAEPTFPRLADLLSGLDYAFPGPDSAKVGGLAASAPLGGGRAAPRTLLCSLPRDILPGARASGAYTSGVVGLTLVGDVQIEAVVAQGCRPLTQAVYRVHDAVRNFILALQQQEADAGNSSAWFAAPVGRDGPAPPPPPPPMPRDGTPLSPAAALQRELASLGSEEPPRHVMVAIAPDSSPASAADFVARPIRGLNPHTGSLAVGDFVRPGQCVRFLVFDQAGAEADLDSACTELARRELARSVAGDDSAVGAPFGALMFSCAGRGRELFRAPHRDSGALAAVMPVSVAGMAANGEIGQVGSRTFLHFFTCVYGVLRHRRWPRAPV